MLRFLLIVTFIFLYAFNFAQSAYLLKDKRYVQYWKSLNDCALIEIDKDGYKGIMLDACLLYKNDKRLIYEIESIIGYDSNRTISVACSVEINNIEKFEQSLLNAQKSGKEEFAFVLLSSGNFYRQYIGLILSNKKYLLISFYRDESCFQRNILRKRNYKLFKLIFSRIFLFKHIDSNGAKYDYFWILYDSENNSITSYHYN